jgi:hypothetical protein
MLVMKLISLLSALQSYVFAICLAATLSLAQANPKPVVELYTDNSGLWFPAGRTLYATIFGDGRIDFMDTSHHDLVIKHSQISASSLAKVEAMLFSDDLRQYKGIIELKHQDARRDYQTNLDVMIHDPNSVHSITFRGFEPENGKPFPPSFNEFLCLIDRLKGVDYRLSIGCK